jgi:hypothetical protein
MRDLETIDSEPRLITAVRRSIRLPSLLQSNLTARAPVDHYLMTLRADDI